MTIRSDINVNWDLSPRIIEVESPSTEILLQDLYDTMRDSCQLLQNMDNEDIIDASGKEALGGGVFVGLTVKLKNAKLKFEDRLSWTICNVLGGNLIAIDDTGEIIEPIEAASYVVAIRTASSSATIYELAEITTKINKMDRNIKVLL